jgi:FtsP/CotA-like multicopper oxidase with cupredoxin domain
VLEPSAETLAALSAAQIALIDAAASDPLIANNIIVGNRSFRWTTAPIVGGNAPGQGSGSLSLAATPFQDVAVIATPGASTTALVLRNNVLTTGNAGIGSNGNIGLDATIAAENAYMVNPYFNSAPGGSLILAGNVVSAEFTTLLSSAAATGEGGNFIDVAFGPLSLAGNYHLEAGVTAIDAGNDPDGAGALVNITNADAQLDFDSEVRAGRYDIGADEYGASGGNVAPTISPNPLDAQYIEGAPVQIKIPASDLNSSDTLTYAFAATNPFMVRNAAGTLVTWSTNLPTINSTTGVISWTAAAVPAFGPNDDTFCTTYFTRRQYQIAVTASDGNGGQAAGTINLDVCRSQGPLQAAADTFPVGTLTTFIVNAPGVLDNDIDPNVDGGSNPLLTSTLVSNTPPTAGRVALATNGSFTFTAVASWVGDTSFVYKASNGASTSNATVTLSRPVTPTLVNYNNTTWTLTGMRSTGAGTGRCIRAVLDRTGVRIGGVVVAAASTIWTIPPATGATPAPAYQTGDTVTITVYDTASAAVCNGVAAPAATVAVLFQLPLLDVNANLATNAQLTTAFVQCPGDTNNNGIINSGETGFNASPATANPATPHRVCRHLAAGDGFIHLADDTPTDASDDKELYTFGFSDVTNDTANTKPVTTAIANGILNANFPAPTLAFDQDDEVFLTLTNVGMLKRPDLFDPHSVHFHGFPNAGTIFDGVPESSIAVNMGSSLTYFYKLQDAGTFMYHCHVEAAEHMQMGMLGSLYVRPRQNRLANNAALGTFTHHTGYKYAYNDGDGSTYYDVEVPVQIGSMDSVFHEEHIGVQPLPFANMRDDYGMLNGRGYPMTIDTGAIPVVAGGEKESSGVTNATESSQKINSLVTARNSNGVGANGAASVAAGQKILLRISNLNVTRFYTLGVTGGLTMRVVGTGAHILRGPGNANLYYNTDAVTLGGGESADVIIDTTGVAPGTYLLYSKNLEALSNGEGVSLGGMMTEIRITP